MRENSYGRAALYGAAGYGGGLALGILAFGLVLRLNLIGLVTGLLPEDQVFIRLLVGLILGLVLAGGAGASGGALGGWAISRVETVASPQRLIRRGALSLGLALGIVIIPLLFLTAVVAFYYDPADRRPLPLISLFAFYGLLFGFLAGIFLAIFTSKLRQSWRVLLSSIAGFTLGGGLMGLFVYWREARGVLDGLPALLFVPVLFLLTGAVGGAMLGIAYHRLARMEATKGERATPPPRWWQISRAVVLLLLAAVGLMVAWNLINLIRYRDADLQAVIPVGAAGTQWADLQLLGEGKQPTLFAAQETPLVAWVAAGDVFYAPAVDGTPTNVSQNPDGQAAYPTGVTDSQGRAHLVWQNETGEMVYGRCQQNTCTPPTPLPAGCGGGGAANAAITIDVNDLVMAVWQEGSGLAYAAWPAAQSPDTGAFGCVIAGGSPEQPQVAATDAGQYQLIFADTERIFTSNFDGSGWSPPVQAAEGHSPSLLTTSDGVFRAWCGLDGQVTVQTPAAVQETIDFPSCHGRIALAQDSEGSLHAVWHSPDVRKVTGVTANDESLIYESVRRNGGWSEPAIVRQTKATEPKMTAVSDGVLHMVWAEDTAVTYTSQTQYDCANPDLNPIEQAVYDALNQPIFKPADEQLPVCGNKYESLFYTPNPVQGVNQLPTLNGAYDRVAEMGEPAQYEVLFGVMQWDAPSNEPSPGSTLAQAAVDLYNEVKANPELYPRGMTVRILTGNMPMVSLLPADDQTWNVLADLQNAGLPELVNEEIGWRLEIADFDGQWPHMHTKIMIVDGKEMMAAGYNYSYLHFSQEHPSELGLGMVDFGIHVTGPVVQAARAAYDDLWAGSDTLTCEELVSEYEDVWRGSCDRGTAVVSHVPEVLKYYVPADADANAYALYRTENHLAADAGIEAALRAAEEKIDISEVNFSLELICDAAIVFQGVCTYEENALPFMTALVETVDAKRIPVRILVEKEAMNGMENRVAIQAMMDELEDRGLRDLVEIRFYNGKLHSKAVNVDNQFLIIGSHNFHYSSWGSTPFSLTEFSIGTDSPQAIEDFQTAFETRWADSIPVEELMPTLAP